MALFNTKINEFIQITINSAVKRTIYCLNVPKNLAQKKPPSFRLKVFETSGKEICGADGTFIF